MADRIQLRRDTAANWTQYNPILLEGEPGIELDTDQWKLGDGIHTWSQLAYRGGEVLQQMGNSTTTAMSQKAVTHAIKSNPNKWFIGNESDIASLGASQRSLMNAILDFWFEPNSDANAIWNNDEYYLKFGIAGFSGKTLNTIDNVFLGVYITNGSEPHLTFSGNSAITNPSEIQHITIDNQGNAGIMHVILDLTKLDFSTFPESPTGEYGYLILNQGLAKGNYLIIKKLSSEYQFAGQNYEKAVVIPELRENANNNIQKIYQPWFDHQLPGAPSTSAYESIKKAVIDFWVSDITDTPSSGNGSWYDDNYKLKIGFFGFDTNSLATATKFWFFVQFTNGTAYKTSINFPQYDIITKNGINHYSAILQTFTGSVKIHLLIDFSLLDFSKISTVTLSDYYYFTTEGVALTSGIFLKKKEYTRYNPLDIKGVDDDILNNSDNLPKSKSVAKYIKSNPNKWFIGNESDIASLGASQRSLMNAILDFWFEPTDSNFNSDSYYLKLGVVGINANTLNNITDIFMSVYITNGSEPYTDFSGHGLIDNPQKVQHLTFTRNAGTMHVVIDLTKLDFSTFPANPTGEYGYLILNMGLAKGYYLIFKKLSSEYQLAFENSLRLDKNDNKLYLPWYLEQKGNVPSFEAIEDVKNCVVDVWATDIRGSWWTDDNFKLKFGFLGFNARTLAEATRGYIFVHLTDDTNYTSAGGIYFDLTDEMKKGVFHKEASSEISLSTTNTFKIHFLLDFSKLDFSHISESPLSGSGGYYYFTSEGISLSHGIFIKKKNSSIFDIKDVKTTPDWFIGSRAQIESYGASQRSLMNAILDFWFEPTDSNFNSDSYYLKLGVVGINANTLNNITDIFMAVYITNGSEPYTDFSGHGLIDNPQKVQHLTFTRNAGTMHVVIDLTKLDFSTFPANPTGEYGYLILNQGLAYYGFILRKSLTSIYKLSSQNKDRIDAVEKIANNANFYKLQYYDKILCAGDSVTAGTVTEGTVEHPWTLNATIPEKSYPTSMGKLLPKADVTIKATPGISATGWLNSYYPNVDFSEYEMIIFELGLNGNDYGYLNTDDLNREGTNTYAYRQIIRGARAQNPTAVIALIRSSHFMGGTALAAIEYIANESNGLVLDLQSAESKAVIDLDNIVLHGYYDNNGTPAVDWAHFTRKGYMCKAFVVASMLEARLSNETVYNV